MKQFVVGTITVNDANDYIRMKSDTAKTMLDFVDALIDRCGGCIVFTTSSSGAMVISWYAAMDYRSSQTIRFGENLLDFTRSDANTSLAILIIPYGAKQGDGSLLTTAMITSLDLSAADLSLLPLGTANYPDLPLTDGVAAGAPIRMNPVSVSNGMLIL